MSVSVPSRGIPRSWVAVRARRGSARGDSDTARGFAGGSDCRAGPPQARATNRVEQRLLNMIIVRDIAIHLDAPITSL